MNILLTIIIVIPGIYILVGFILFLIQRKLIFIPHKELVATPDNIQLPYEDINFFTSDKVQLNGWFIPNSKQKNSNGKTILFNHGNAGNISHRLETIRIFHSMGYSVFVYDYRSYGKSHGKITEEGTYNDAEAAWNYLTDKKGFNPNDIIVVGRSLGGAIAAQLATRVTPYAVILESTFTSIPEMALHMYPIYPFKSIIRYKYPNTKFVPQIKSPVLLIHSPDDNMVPFKHGKILFDKLKSQQKSFLKITGSHNSGFLDSEDEYKKGIKEFVEY